MRLEPKLWVICAFRNRPDLLEKSLASIAAQDHEGHAVLVGDDQSRDPDVTDVLEGFDGLPGWTIHRRPLRLGVIGNQVELIRSVEMHPEDVLVFLDGDDRFANPWVLSYLQDVYRDRSVDLTYGSYRPEPFHDGCLMARPIPPEACAVIGGYRRWAKQNGTAWNHLRTFRRRIFDAIPDNYLQLGGQWCEGGADYAMMTPGLELAGGRHRFIERVLVLYTSDRPDAEWRTVTKGIRATHRHIQSRRPLKPLPPLED